MINYSNENVKILLRIGVFLIFLGHGVFAIQGNPSWIPYIETVGFSAVIAKKLILYIGILDIIVAIMVLLKPNKYIVLWAILWTFLTAIIRPISGESIWAFVERGGNWIVPLCLYFLMKIESK